MKIDPYKSKEIYLGWKGKIRGDIPGISKANSDMLKQYLADMEVGLNIGHGSKKGARSYGRLRVIINKIIFFSEQFEKFFGLDDITKINEEQLHTFFMKMRNGEMKKHDGKQYLSINYFTKVFKAFWHWYMKVQKKKGVIINDITADLDTSGEKPIWVYLTEEQVKLLCEHAKYDHKVLIMFLFDTGIRAPTELMNIRVGDFYDNFTKLLIRDEVSKTFGRKINLMLCSDLIKEYIKKNELKADDCLFGIDPHYVNKYLKRLAIRLIGEGKSPAGDYYYNLSLYDFRHSSACYWLPRYKSESAMKYRFGWKKSEMIHYYTEFLGMRDTISEDDLLVDVTKTEIEQKLIKSEKENEILTERLGAIEKDLQIVREKIKKLENVAI